MIEPGLYLVRGLGLSESRVFTLICETDSPYDQHKTDDEMYWIQVIDFKGHVTKWYVSDNWLRMLVKL